MIYFIVGFYLFFLSYIYDLKGYAKYFKLHYYLSLILLILIAGLRYRMAPDSIVYLNDFLYRTNKLTELNLEDIIHSRYQPLWVILNSLCKQFTDQFFIMQTVTAIILNGSIFYFFKDTTTKFFTCILFYFISVYLYFNMEIMRESLALAMFLLSMLMFSKEKYLKCAMFFIFAYLFHAYAIVLGILYIFLIKKVPKKLKIFILIVIASVLILVKNPILLLAGFFGGSMSESIADYNEAKLGVMTITGYIYMFMRIYVVYYAIKKFKKLETIPNINFNKEILINIGTLYIFLVIIRTISIPFLERILNYFTMFIILFLTATLFQYINTKVLQTLRANVFCIIICLISFYNIYPMFKFIELWNAPFYRRYYPYSSVIYEEQNQEREFINYVEAKEYR